ncbi:putative UDP-Gal or UDP-GlcNAc-dependent glycosyltransferase [Trypanosoma theileri]|uniref:Hexosyltransferase n=1 Tax=Trypanosoma theileri TaxID=67003 RepID=A0A1X0NJQ2_9TRYP|nr:putative UDP-Gal or UDP-GlcNAc-dependent glycosyltransferase [Trypanosoma theileri]ORC84821.1 putative UDP-Gal or UDP-GlcNAc-dependent glycosyltransferase [Trypanosoma theileri]
MKIGSSIVNQCSLFIYMVCVAVLFMIWSLPTSLSVQPVSENTFEGSSSLHSFTEITVPLPENTSSLDESLPYIPHSTVQTWKERDYLIVFGIPSVDIDGRRRRRYLQRTTCWQFPGVARRANNFTGAMLVLYVLARHPSKGYKYSESLLKEVAEYHDIITLPINEGRSSTNKTIGRNGYWGTEAEVGMGRKVFMWFEKALKLFPHVSFIAKGDDDIFLRVPQFLYQLEMLPRNGMYWGAIYAAKTRDFDIPIKYRFALGPCYTLSRDAAVQLVSYLPVKRLVYLPYSEKRLAEYAANYVNSEDMMVGYILRKSNYHNKLVYFMERRCSFHDVHEGVRPEPVRRTSMMIHHLWESEYKEFMEMFGNDTNPLRRIWKKIARGRIEFYCR